MDHDEAKGLLSDYLEGEISEENRADLEKHLEGCTDCRQELDALKETLNVLSGFRKVEAPEDFESKVTNRLKRRSRRRDHDSSPLSHKIPFETICLIMLLILAAFYIMLYLLPQMQEDREFKQDTEIRKDRLGPEGDGGESPSKSKHSGGKEAHRWR